MADRTPNCFRCDDCGWVCEAHPERPWQGPLACECGAPGAPCPDCNSSHDISEGIETPRLPFKPEDESRPH
jgi:hypothetical protein